MLKQRDFKPADNKNKNEKDRQNNPDKKYHSNVPT